MSRVVIAPATRLDRDELVRSNRDSRAYHEPWVEPFVDDAGFDAWLMGPLTGPQVRLVAREIESGRITGVVNLLEIVGGTFSSPRYLKIFGEWRDHERWARLSDDPPAP
ncbi:MAG: hypothetical protein JO227_25365 [Acetobacteraceae bacterium]|nr:hypothetical protein [Acetobacteraceae bacterium]